jgi:ATP-dependent DNA ligase
MNLAVNPPVLPMLAKRVSELPQGEGWIVIAGDGGLEFETLQMRLHPAESRVKKLAAEIPASVVLFDILCEGSKSLCEKPFGERRARLESLFADAEPPLHLTPATRDLALAGDWFRRFEGAGLDGVIAKPIDGTYEPNKRVMLKVKHERECDCVVAGFRWHKTGGKTKVGSLLLGLYGDTGNLEHVGVCASFTDVKRKELVKFLEPYRKKALEEHPWRDWAEADESEEPHRMPGGQSRWSAGKDLSWEPLRPELVLQVAYDHMQGDRFRHTAQFRRWRTDKRPRDCTYEQLEVVAPHELAAIFATGR